MEYSGLNVLLTEGGSRQTLPMAKAFSELGCRVTTLNSSSLDVGNVSKYPTKKIIGRCTPNDHSGTKNEIERILKNEKYDLVVPMSDFTASLLSKNKAFFSQYAEIATTDWEIFNNAFDKLNTMKICMDNGIPCPKTILNVESVDDLKEMKFPVVIKPRSGWGSIGFNIVESKEKLSKILKTTDTTLGPMFVQEYIPQTAKQFNAHMFLDSNHNVKTALITEKNRWFPIDGGASTLSITVDRPDIVDICSRLLKEMKWVGYCDVDLILDPRDDVPKIIEINARISANVKICYLVGVNIARQIVESYLGNDVTQYDTYKKDVRLRSMHTDLLWFLKSKSRLKIKPSWFSFKHTSDQIFSLTDIKPWFAFTIQAFKNYRNEMRKRKRKN